MDPTKNRFFGRERVLREITAGVLGLQPGSFTLVGTKYTGKTSLLHYLAADDGPLMAGEFKEWRPPAFVETARVIVTLLDCSWQEIREDLLGYLVRHLRRQLDEQERVDLDWRAVDEQTSAARQIWQMARQLKQHGYRLVVMLDNFDRVFEEQMISRDNADELRPLAMELALVVASQQPLHDLDRDLAASPLFNVMTQLYIGLIEASAARAWLEAYRSQFPAVDELTDLLLELTGTHPFLLRRVGDILAEVQQYLISGQEMGIEHADLVRLRMAEHGRLLFATQLRKLQNPERASADLVQTLVLQMLDGPLPAAKLNMQQRMLMNWLINQAVVIYSDAGYRLYSPIFAEFLAARLEPVAGATPQRATNGVPFESLPIYAQLTKTEEALLRYFRARSNTVVSPEDLLADVWRRPGASPRRVQEAIRRLRLQLAEADPPVGTIENERGRGYRYVPAAG